MRDGLWLSVTALVAAIVAIGLGIAALVLALDDDAPVQPTFNLDLGAAGEDGRLLPRLEEFFERFSGALPGARTPEEAEMRPVLGVTGEDGDNGVTVRAVSAGSGADEAGLQARDLITAVDGTAVTRVDALREAIAEYHPGDTITLSVQRGDAVLELDATLGETAAPRFRIPIPSRPASPPPTPTPDASQDRL